MVNNHIREKLLYQLVRLGVVGGRPALFTLLDAYLESLPGAHHHPIETPNRRLGTSWVVIGHEAEPFWPVCFLLTNDAVTYQIPISGELREQVTLTPLCWNMENEKIGT
jgi:hypothetical protein